MNKTLFVSTTQRSVIQFMNKPSDWKRIIKQEMLYPLRLSGALEQSFSVFAPFF